MTLLDQHPTTVQRPLSFHFAALVLLLESVLVFGPIVGAQRPRAMPIKAIALVLTAPRFVRSPRTSKSSESKKGGPSQKTAAEFKAEKEREAAPDLRRHFSEYRAMGAAGRSSVQMLVDVNQAWAGFLRAYGAEIALAPYTPSVGTAILCFRAGAGLRETRLPAGVTVREIDSPAEVPLDGFAEALADARRHFHESVRAFTVYPDDLLAAMQGKVLADLRARNYTVDLVRSVEIDYIMSRTGDYDIQLRRVTLRDP